MVYYILIQRIINSSANYMFAAANMFKMQYGGDYMNNYFAGRYGAIRDIDFSPMLEKIMLQDKICQ